jgi:hypothetical protein
MKQYAGGESSGNAYTGSNSPGGSFMKQYGGSWVGGVQLTVVSAPNATDANLSNVTLDDDAQKKASDAEKGRELAKHFVAKYAPSELQNLSFNVTNGSAWSHDMGKELARRFITEYQPSSSENSSAFANDFMDKYVPTTYQGYMNGSWATNKYADGYTGSNPGGSFMKQYAAAYTANVTELAAASHGSKSGALLAAGVLAGVSLPVTFAVIKARWQRTVHLPEESKVHLLA